jgi:hypothetical protein
VPEQETKKSDWREPPLWSELLKWIVLLSGLGLVAYGIYRLIVWLFFAS